MNYTKVKQLKPFPNQLYPISMFKEQEIVIFSSVHNLIVLSKTFSDCAFSKLFEDTANLNV